MSRILILYKLRVHTIIPRIQQPVHLIRRLLIDQEVLRAVRPAER